MPREARRHESLESRLDLYAYTRMTDINNHLETYKAARPRLFSLAYRMTGSYSDSEDILQDAYLKFARVPAEKIQSAAALLTTIVTRLCLDLLRSSRRKREIYIGPWLPEPVPDLYLAHEEAADKETISIAFLTVLQRLAPVERAVFILREVFDFDYPEIAGITGKSADYCRQIFHRAKKNLRQTTRPPPLPQNKERELLAAFLSACNSPNMDDLLRLLKEDMLYVSDGGGIVPAARIPLHRARQVAKFIFAVRDKVRATKYYVAYINAAPAVVGYEGDQINFIQIIEPAKGRVQGLFTVLNPEKLEHFANRRQLIEKGILTPISRFLSPAQILRFFWQGLWRRRARA